LGQAAVQASIISPILVIIVAITALGSFSITNYSFQLTIRLLHYLMIFAAALLGIYGMALFALLLLASMSARRSFGVPLTSPVAPQVPTSPDLVMRAPLVDMERRPAYTRPLDRVRQKVVQRAW